MIVGIDLGTTYSAVSRLSAEGPQIVLNALEERLTPSVVGVDPNGEILVGRAAQELQVTHPERCASAFKRHMGSDWHTELAGREFDAVQLSSLVLTTLKRDVEARLDVQDLEAVITVPAYFNEHQRKATIRAGEIAGLKVRRIINEPTAAAIAYGLHGGNQEQRVLVFDLGGGTFDVSIVEVFEGTIEVRASCGDSMLGGEDFTQALAARAVESLGLAYERIEVTEPLRVSRLLRQCELAKCRLSRLAETKIRIPNAQGELSEDGPEVTVSRLQFEQWTAPLLRGVTLPLARALSDAGLRPDQIDEILLVGGATRMPAVVDLLETRFRKPPRQRLNPDEVVALGAAVQAGLLTGDQSLGDFMVTDVAPFTLGTMVCKELGGDMRPGYFLPVIHRNTTIPVSRVRRLATISPNQNRIEIEIYQGENRRAADNHLLGRFVVEGLPKGPPRDAVDLRFTYDLNGVLEVEATILETGRTTTHLITRHATGLTAEQIERAVQEMQSLKLSPREEAAHRLLIRRAERIYGELPVDRQRFLGQLLDSFEAALAEGDKPAAERYRIDLQEYLDQIDTESGGYPEPSDE